ncbi:MAG: hypothetical protein VKP57_11430 [Candidatus Sericytochromatia bacterium]|nr:hypothetical protein [Candidatus Sericytochromatia bacterium]
MRLANLAMAAMVAAALPEAATLPEKAGPAPVTMSTLENRLPPLPDTAHPGPAAALPGSTASAVPATVLGESWPEPMLDYEISFESDLGPGLLALPGSGSFRLRARNQTQADVGAIRLDYTALRPCPGLPATGSVLLPPLEPGQAANLRWDFASLPGQSEATSGSVPEEIDYVFEVVGNVTGFIPPARVHVVLQDKRETPRP